MSKLPRRSKKAKPPTAPSDAPASPQPPAKARPKLSAKAEPRASAKPKPPAKVNASAEPKPPAKAKAKPPRPDPADQLEERLKEPEEGAYLYGLERRIVHPTLGQRIVAVLGEHDSAALWPLYENLEFEVGWARERSAFGYGFEHGAAQGRAEAFRRQAPGLGKPARRLADQARSLVVNEGLSSRDAAALLLETTWVVLLAEAPPAFDG